ncbi:hypothetical protein Peur_026413 [Populus x canadensis]
MKVTENDLKLVNNELVKFLEAEEEGCNDSIARRSYVSTITLSGMQMQATNAEDFGKTVACPLQGYLFGSSIEHPETRFGAKKEKVLKMFHRKVHPENPLAENEFMKSHIDKTMNTLNEGGYNADLMHQVKDKRKFLPGSKSKAM